MNFRTYCSTLPYVLLFAIVLLPVPGRAQRLISGDISLKGYPRKSYAIYLPKNHLQRKSQVVLSFHPLNSLAWNAESWCKRLVPWAESQGLILICPDGGSTGQVDDPIDLQFASSLADTLHKIHGLFPGQMILHGYSWGARAALKYATLFPGQVSGLVLLSYIADGNESRLRLERLRGKPIYFAQGERDNNVPKVLGFQRALQELDCYTGYDVISNSGHEFSSAQINLSLTQSWNWVMEHPALREPVLVLPVVSTTNHLDVSVKPHPIQTGKAIMIARGDLIHSIRRVTIYNSRGETVQRFSGYQHAMEINALKPGVYVVTCEVEGFGWLVRKVLVM